VQPGNGHAARANNGGFSAPISAADGNRPHHGTDGADHSRNDAGPIGGIMATGDPERGGDGDISTTASSDSPDGIRAEDDPLAIPDFLRRNPSPPSTEQQPDLDAKLAAAADEMSALLQANTQFRAHHEETVTQMEDALALLKQALEKSSVTAVS
jgi:hypothetical protein